MCKTCAADPKNSGAYASPPGEVTTPAPTSLMLYVCGVPVAVEDARWLIPRLHADGDFDAIGAANVIHAGFEQDLWSVDLTDPQRLATLRQLQEPPDGLADLRRVLSRTPKPVTFETT